MQRRDAAGIERHLLARAIADPQDNRMTAEVERQCECASATRGRRQGGKPAGIGLQRHVPAMVRPGRVRDAELAKHLRRKVQDRQRLVILLNAEFRPIGIILRLPLHFAVRHC